MSEIESVYNTPCEDGDEKNNILSDASVEKYSAVEFNEAMSELSEQFSEIVEIAKHLSDQLLNNEASLKMKRFFKWLTLNLGLLNTHYEGKEIPEENLSMIKDTLTTLFEDTSTLLTKWDQQVDNLKTQVQDNEFIW